MKRIRKILETSQSGNRRMSPLLTSREFLKRKGDLVDYLVSLGFELLDDESTTDLNGDGEDESLLLRFERGDVMVIALLGNYTQPDPKVGRSGNFQYAFRVSMSKNAGGEVLLDTQSREAWAEDISGAKRVLPKYIEMGRLKGLGVKDAKGGGGAGREMISKAEYDELLDAAIGDKNWAEATRLQKEWGDVFYKEGMANGRRRISGFEQFGRRDV